MMDQAPHELGKIKGLFSVLQIVCFGWFYGKPTQHRPYSAEDTLESVNDVESNSCFKHIGINVNC